MSLNFPNIYNDKKLMNDALLHGSMPVMRAKVINNNDPKKIGRIQVRIPSFHGVPELTDRFIPDEDLPWAVPCVYGGCGQDWGSFLVPIPGTFVWLLFEDNDAEKPIYLGGVTSIPNEKPKTVNNLNDPASPQQPWDTDPGKENITWDEFTGKSTGVPERDIIYKSQKGHTIMCDDTDGEESMTFIDRVGQVIKFFCGVSKGKNGERYHRELYSAEKDEQLGEGLAGDSSIMIRSGEIQDGDKIHSMFRMYHDHMRTECIDGEQTKHTTTDYSPYEYNQETQESILNMTEDHIFMKFKDFITEYFCDNYWSLTAFEKNRIECTPDHMYAYYDGNGIFIDSDKVKIHFKDTSITLDEKTLRGKTKEEYSFAADGSSFSGTKDLLSGKSKEVKFEGSGKVYTDGGKTYMTGTEIHFNKG